MWTDARPDARSSAIAAFSTWSHTKTGGSVVSGGLGSPQHPPPTEATAASATATVTFEETVEEAGDDVVGFARAELVETHPDGSRWQTILRTWRADAESDGTWIWVDVDAVSPAGIADVSIAAPRLVRSLLTDGVLTRSGPVELAPFPLYLSGEDGGERLA